MAKSAGKIYIKYLSKVYTISDTAYVPEKIAPNGTVRSDYLSIGRKIAAQIIRQYIKSEYPTIKALVSSECFSGGTSVTVHLFNKEDGSEVEDNVYNDVCSFSKTLRSGKFDGMTDSFQYVGDTHTDNGMRMARYTKFISVQNGAPYDYKLKQNTQKKHNI